MKKEYLSVIYTVYHSKTTFNPLYRMKKKVLSTRWIKLLFVACLLSVSSLSVFGQYLRSFYFMDNVSAHMGLNPALRPSHGFIDIPVVGALSGSVSSNTFGMKDVIHIIDSDGNFYNSNKLYNRLKRDNRLNVNLNADLFSIGFYTGKHFWTLSVGLRSDINASIPRSMFDYARDFHSPETGTTGSYRIESLSFNANAYAELGAGYSRAIGDKLIVGGKFKILLGLANVKMNIDELSITEGGTYSELVTKGELSVAMRGVSVKNSTDNVLQTEVVDDVSFDKFGIAGYGMGIDLGASYKILDNLTLSAAILDLGFISWSKGSTTRAVANASARYEYDSYNFLFEGDLLDFNLPKFENRGENAYQTSLASTLVWGGEYTFLDNKLGAGILSTTRFGRPKTFSELTFSANYRPKSWLGVTLSYSVLQSDMKTFGMGCRLGPFFIGTDYMFLSSSSSQSVNAYLGVSIPLAD